jgi:signal peptidase I
MNPEELTHSLRKEAILNGHSVKTIASGTSMFPFLRKGDLLTIEPLSMDKIKRGDVVVFECEEKWIAHRVIKIHSNDGLAEFTTRGDARVSNDPPVRKENYIGIVSYLERNNKYISLTSFRKKTSTQFLLLGGKPLSFFLNHLARKKK